MKRMGDHLSGPTVARRLEHPTRSFVWSRRAASRCLFGLAGGGVCLAADVTIRAVRSYRTFSPLPFRAVYFLWHFPSARAGLVLPTTVPCPVRTFLPNGEPSERSPSPAPPERLNCKPLRRSRRTDRQEQPPPLQSWQEEPQSLRPRACLYARPPFRIRAMNSPPPLVIVRIRWVGFRHPKKSHKKVKKGKNKP